MTTDELIEVRCFPSGDTAYADEPEAALVAAKQLCEDDQQHRPILGRERTVEFRVEGLLVRTLRERDLWGARA